MFFYSAAVDLGNQIIEALLVDVFLTQLAFKQGSWCLPPAKALHINILYQPAVGLVIGFFQFIPTQFYIEYGLTGWQLFDRDLHISSNTCDQIEILQEIPLLRVFRAGDGDRTRDFLLGKEMLYH